MLSPRGKKELKINQRRILINSIEIGIPSPEQVFILGQRHTSNGKVVGRVRNSKTLNYKSFTPHRDGLFCERIFGPVQSYICACGKQGPLTTSKGTLKFCPRCEVEYTDQRARRYRVGYIGLVSPVTHIWHLKGRPSYLSLFLGKRKKTLATLAYCNDYLVEQAFSKVDVNRKFSLAKPTGALLSEAEHSPPHGRPARLRPAIGANFFKNRILKGLTESKVIKGLTLSREQERSKVWYTFRAPPEGGQTRAKLLEPPFGGQQLPEHIPERNLVANFDEQNLAFATRKFGLLPSPFGSTERSSIAPKGLESKEGLDRASFLKSLRLPKGSTTPLPPSSVHVKCEGSPKRAPLLGPFGANRNVVPAYTRSQTLPFLPTFICEFHLRDGLLSFFDTFPPTEDIPIPVYCQIPRRYPLRDVHKFMADQAFSKVQVEHNSTKGFGSQTTLRPKGEVGLINGKDVSHNSIGTVNEERLSLREVLLTLLLDRIVTTLIGLTPSLATYLNRPEPAIFCFAKQSKAGGEPTVVMTRRVGSQVSALTKPSVLLAANETDTFDAPPCFTVGKASAIGTTFRQSGSGLAARSRAECSLREQGRSIRLTNRNIVPACSASLIKRYARPYGGDSSYARSEGATTAGPARRSRARPASAERGAVALEFGLSQPKSLSSTKVEQALPLLLNRRGRVSTPNKSCYANSKIAEEDLRFKHAKGFSLPVIGESPARLTIRLVFADGWSDLGSLSKAWLANPYRPSSSDRLACTNRPCSRTTKAGLFGPTVAQSRSARVRVATKMAEEPPLRSWATRAKLLLAEGQQFGPRKGQIIADAIRFGESVEDWLEYWFDRWLQNCYAGEPATNLAFVQARLNQSQTLLPFGAKSGPYGPWSDCSAKLSTRQRNWSEVLPNPKALKGLPLTPLPRLAEGQTRTLPALFAKRTIGAARRAQHLLGLYKPRLRRAPTAPTVCSGQRLTRRGLKVEQQPTVFDRHLSRPELLARTNRRFVQTQQELSSSDTRQTGEQVLFKQSNPVLPSVGQQFCSLKGPLLLLALRSYALGLTDRPSRNVVPVRRFAISYTPPFFSHSQMARIKIQLLWSKPKKQNPNNKNLIFSDDRSARDYKRDATIFSESDAPTSKSIEENISVGSTLPERRDGWPVLVLSEAEHARARRGLRNEVERSLSEAEHAPLGCSLREHPLAGSTWARRALEKYKGAGLQASEPQLRQLNKSASARRSAFRKTPLELANQAQDGRTKPDVFFGNEDENGRNIVSVSRCAASDEEGPAKAIDDEPEIHRGSGRLLASPSKNLRTDSYSKGCRPQTLLGKVAQLSKAQPQLLLAEDQQEQNAIASEAGKGGTDSYMKAQLDLQAIQEVLSYTGGGALRELLRCFDTQAFSVILLNEIKLLREYHKGYFLYEYNQVSPPGGEPKTMLGVSGGQPEPCSWPKASYPPTGGSKKLSSRRPVGWAEGPRTPLERPLLSEPDQVDNAEDFVRRGKLNKSASTPRVASAKKAERDGATDGLRPVRALALFRNRNGFVKPARSSKTKQMGQLERSSSSAKGQPSEKDNQIEYETNYEELPEEINRFSRAIHRNARRLKIVQLLMRNKRRPEWMLISALPVLPPDLRPILQMSENLIVASDLNTLYQRVIYRNNRQYKLRIVEWSYATSLQRLVQDAVDRLLENGKGGSKPFLTPGGRPLKSLSDTLKGKKGRFRLNLLGKRVDFSGRSVIVVSPHLKIHECGLPREMALELYQYLLIRQMLLKRQVSSVILAKRVIRQQKAFVWDTLRELIYHHPILLNRAPTLHRLGIQAFQPKLVLGNTILLHPLVCAGFNADFDGDQMGVHLPLCDEARAEAWDLLWSRNNLLSPATGEPILLPSQDMVLGFYHMTALLPSRYATSTAQAVGSARSLARSADKTERRRGSGFVQIDARPTQARTPVLFEKGLRKSHFFSPLDVVRGYQNGDLDIHTPIWLQWNGKIENNDSDQTPLEVRITSFGVSTQLYPSYKSRKDAISRSTATFNLFIRTTPGRVIVNNIFIALDATRVWKSRVLSEAEQE